MFKMAEEDEIDIEGDFEFKLGSSESLTAGVLDSELPSHSVNLLPEFTQPSWMLDQAWCLDHLDDKSKVTVEKMLLEEQHYVNGKTPTSTVITSSIPAVKKSASRQPWTEEEKELFKKGMDIFGRSWLKISELIPNKSHIQVKNYAQQYFKSKAKEENKLGSPNKIKKIQHDLRADTILDEVLASVSTAKPTINVTNYSKPNLKNSVKFKSCKTIRLSPKSKPAAKSQRKGHMVIPEKQKIHKNVNNGEVIVMKKKNEDTESSSDEVDIDIEDDLDTDFTPVMTSSDSVYQKLLASANITDFDKTDDIAESSDSNSDQKDEIETLENLKTGEPVVIHKGELLNLPAQMKLVDNVPGISPDSNDNLIMPSTSSEKVQIIEETNHDSGISDKDKPPINTNESCTPRRGDSESNDKLSDLEKTDSAQVCASLPPERDKIEEDDWDDGQEVDMHENETAVLTSSGEMMYLPNPTEEIQIDKNTICDMEKTIHSEFFEGRITKTPERYLRIRNFITDSWLKVKPSYLNKTGLRAGLKNCGDVNCIGRIHAYLEQIGCINFGCENCAYNRPKSKLVIYPREKPTKDERQAQIVDRMESMRPRKRRVRDTFGDWVDEKELEGKTINHSAAARDQLVPSVKVPRIRNTYDPFKLIPCSQFSAVYPAPFILEMSALSMTIMDIHSHLSKTEVIGLLGGRYLKEQGKLVVTMAEPCQSLSTGMQCEMDPVSQSQASELIQERGFRVLGWYHSHPTFVPNPSVRDLETQEKYQSWLCRDGCPFIGAIVSPYNRENPSLHSQVKCLVAVSDPKANYSSSVPYQFDFTVTPSGIHREHTLFQLKSLAGKYEQDPNHVNLMNFYKRINNITCLEKMLQSVGRYLELEGEIGSLMLEDLKNSFSLIFGNEEFT